jgi:GT2 family glycosyltransferase
VSQLGKALAIARLHFGSPTTLSKKAITIYRREGIRGLRARVRHLLESSTLPNVAPSYIERTKSREIQRHTCSVDIIVCVHNALADVKNCLESINCYTLPPFRLIVVDDGSAEETQVFLADYAKQQGCVLHRNNVAGGYTKAANCGLRLSDADFSVLLNSDTIVTPYWLERMLACVNSDDRIGIVGPLSNTASWQSVPEIFDVNGDWTDNPLPPGFTIQSYADEIAKESLRIYPKVGFINGFCFLIKRELIAEIGIFDEAVFGRGYGEENDFCLRAAKANWKLAIADDAYVYHAQSKSYSHERRMELSKAAGVNLANKHGQTIIDQQLNITANHPALEYIRQRTSLIME